MQGTLTAEVATKKLIDLEEYLTSHFPLSSRMAYQINRRVRALFVDPYEQKSAKVLPASKHHR
jgi:hypothetical protein